MKLVNKPQVWLWDPLRSKISESAGFTLIYNHQKGIQNQCSDNSCRFPAKYSTGSQCLRIINVKWGGKNPNTQKNILFTIFCCSLPLWVCQDRLFSHTLYKRFLPSPVALAPCTHTHTHTKTRDCVGATDDQAQAEPSPTSETKTPRMAALRMLWTC